jgi:DNA-binding CsgD family transcriptional regulator
MPATKYFQESLERETDLRRALPGQRKTFEVQEMHELHHEIVRRLLLGQKSSQIAEDLSCSAATVSYVKNSRIVKEKLNLMQGARDAEVIDLSKRIREKAPVALDLLVDIIEGKGEAEGASIHLRAKEANNLLSRAGYPLTSRSEQLVAHFTPQEIEDLKKQAYERKGIKPPAELEVIDV